MHPKDALTARQSEILMMLAKGMRRYEIIHQLGFTGKTYDKHMDNAMKRMKARTRYHLMAIYMRQLQDIGR